jgi:hypothetical protein
MKVLVIWMWQTMGYAPFELNGGYMLSMIHEICSDSAIAKGVKEFAHQALLNLANVHDTIIETCIFQTHHANNCQSSELKITQGDLVFLSMQNLNIVKGRARKLCPNLLAHIRS